MINAHYKPDVVNMTLEICANSVESARIAYESGAQRVELCNNLNEGGTTPSYGQVALAVKLLKIKVFVLIRPRAGDFLYSDLEFDIMKQDILMCKHLKCDGIVIGLLQKDGQIDYERTKELVSLAAPMEVTFHRAFDQCKDPEKAIEAIIQTGCKRILTSGMKESVATGIENIGRFIRQANGRIIIMPGGGVKAANINEIRERTGAMEFHTSAKKTQGSSMTFQFPGMKTTELEWMQSDANEIKKILRELQK